MNRLAFILLHLLLLASTVSFGDEYSILKTGDRNGSLTGDMYLDEIQPLLGKRCAVCHSCTAGPCQLNLMSYEGLIRGVNKVNPHFLFGHLRSTARTRLEDQLPIEAWRKLGFSPVVGDFGDAETNKEKSILFQAISLGMKNDPTNPEFDAKVVRSLGLQQETEKHHCPIDNQEYETFQHKFAFGGMPWGAPSLNEKEYNLLRQWIEMGAPGPSPDALKKLSTPKTPGAIAVVEAWENFLNGSRLESQVVARYIYEHTVSANIQFEENQGVFYRIVRSKKPYPQDIDLIVTEYPTDAPDYTGRIYYRLQQQNRLIEMKKHNLLELNLAAVDHYRTMFFSEDWTVSELPGYPFNPFAWFSVIPARSRSDFVRENARIMANGLGRGTVCHSRNSSYVGDDHVWYWFLKPESDPTVMDPSLGLSDPKSFYFRDRNLQDTLSEFKGRDWGEKIFQNAFEKSLAVLRPNGLGIDDVWTGDGKYPNAWLYGIRHETSYEFFNMQKAPLVGYPQSVLLWSYANFERYYYNAAVHFKYWGSLKHKLDTFMFTTLHTSEAEDLYLTLNANVEERVKLRNTYLSPQGKAFNDLGTFIGKNRPSTTPKSMSYNDIAVKLYDSLDPMLHPFKDTINGWPKVEGPVAMADSFQSTQDLDAALRTMVNVKGTFAGFMPNVIHMRINGSELYTLIAHRAHRRDRIPLMEKSARTPKDDTMTVFKGYRGAFPHFIVDLNLATASIFLKQMNAVRTEKDWSKLRSDFMIKKNSAEFWPLIDWLHDYVAVHEAEGAGLLDIRNYDLRDIAY